MEHQHEDQMVQREIMEQSEEEKDPLVIDNCLLR